MSKILVIEDDKEINRLICEYLASVGYEMCSESNGMAGLNAIKRMDDIDLVLLDLMLPLKSGDMVLSAIREFSSVPVIVLSAKDTVQTKIELIKMGADDYITKPFDLDEVAVRIESVLKRYNFVPKNVEKAGLKDVEKELKYKKMVIDTDLAVITVNGNELELTTKEYAILKLMLSNPTKLFSKANLYESVWNDTYFAEDNTLKVHMSNIRNKIKKFDEDEYIETVWGMGYKLAK